MTPEEERVVAWTLLGEAAGDGTLGMTAVANVIRNRTLSGRYPSNPAMVALQGSGSRYAQFSAWNAISQGGNLPRARYPVGTDIFNKALGIVRGVFSTTPGTDPTRGATHYYAPKGMPGGNAPYWWEQEATHGALKIGTQIFAPKYAVKDRVTPQQRSGGARDFSPSGLGRGASRADLMAFNSENGRIRLPTLAAPGSSSRSAPTPAVMSFGLRHSRENESSTGERTTLVIDPITQQVMSRTNISDLVREAGRTSEQPSKSVQYVAGFAVPGGTAGISQVELAREAAAPKPKPVSASDKARGNGLSHTGGATLFADPEERLAPGPEGLGEFSASDLARQARRPPLAPKIAPPIPKPVQLPMPQVRAPLRVEVTGARVAPVAKVIAQSPVEYFRSMGFSPSQSYDMANQKARDQAASRGMYTSDNASSNGGRGSGPGGSLAPGDRSYDPDTNSWN